MTDLSRIVPDQGTAREQQRRYTPDTAGEHPDPHAVSTRRTLKTLHQVAVKQVEAHRESHLGTQWEEYRHALAVAAMAYERIGS